MDKYWTNFQENTWNHEHAFILDKSWTKIGHGQNIDKIWTNNFVTSSKHILTELGQNVDIFFVQILSNIQKPWTE